VLTTERSLEQRKVFSWCRNESIVWDDIVRQCFPDLGGRQLERIGCT